MCETPNVLIVEDMPADRELVAQAVIQVAPGARVTAVGDEAAFDLALRMETP